VSPPRAELPAKTSCVTLAVGARYACFFCRVRAQRPGRCERCGRSRFELAGESANSRLVQLARRVFKATVVHGAKPERERALTMTAHLIALVGAGVSVWMTHHYSSHFAAPSLLLFALAAGLGYVGGYLSVALVLLLLWLTTAAAALAVSSVILALASVLTALSLLVPKPHGVSPPRRRPGGAVAPAAEARGASSRARAAPCAVEGAALRRDARAVRARSRAG
jgi:hypothetical protein